MTSPDRQDALRQNRNDLDTHDTTPRREGDEAQTREQRRHHGQPHAPERKPKNG
jgi:hypothetical protein